jgi:hypothetical protein
MKEKYPNNQYNICILMNNLAEILYQQDKFEDSRKIHNECLEIRK